MRFKAFMELYGKPSAMGGESAVHQSMKIKNPFGKGQSIKRKMNAGPKLTRPANPVGMTSPNRSMTIKSVLK